MEKTDCLLQRGEGLYRNLDPTKGWEKLSITDYIGRVYTVTTNAEQPV